MALQWIKTDVLEYKKSFYLWSSGSSQAILFTSWIMEEEIKKFRREKRPLKKIRLATGRKNRKGQPFTIKAQSLPAWNSLDKPNSAAFIFNGNELVEIPIPFPKQKQA